MRHLTGLCVFIFLFASSTYLSAKMTLSFLDKDPKLKNQLLLWEKQAPENLKWSIERLRGKDSVARYNAAAGLMGEGKQARGAILALLENLDDHETLKISYGLGSKPNMPDRTHAAIQIKATLVSFGDIALPIMAAALKDDDWNMRVIAAKVLGEMRNKKAARPLMAAMDDPDAPVRSEVYWALRMIKAEEAIEPMIKKMDTDLDNLDRLVSSLGLFRKKRVIQPIIRAMLKKPEQAFTYSLSLQNVSEQWYATKEAKQIVPELAKAIVHGDLKAREGAILVLGYLRQEKYATHIAKALQDNDETIRIAAAEALLKMKTRRVNKELLAALNDKNKKVRIDAASALGNAGAKEAIEPLIKILSSDPDKDVRVSVIYDLEQLKASQAIPALIDAMVHLNSVLAKDALDKINPGWIKTEAAKKKIPDIIKALDHEEKDIRYTAIKALGVMRTTHANQKLIAMLQNPYEIDNHDRIIETMGMLGSPEFIKPLKDLIEKTRKTDNDFFIGSVLRALGGFKSEQATAMLIESLVVDRGDYLEKTAKDSLRKQNPYWCKTRYAKQAVPGLIALLQKNKFDYGTVSTLECITGKKLGYKYEKWHRWYASQNKKNNKK